LNNSFTSLAQIAARPGRRREERPARHRAQGPLALSALEQHRRHGELHRLAREELDRRVRHHGLVRCRGAKDQAVVRVLHATGKPLLRERLAHGGGVGVDALARGSVVPGTAHPEQVEIEER